MPFFDRPGQHLPDVLSISERYLFENRYETQVKAET